MKPYIYTIISSILLFGCTPEPLTPEQQKAYVETNSKCETDNYKKTKFCFSPDVNSPDLRPTMQICWVGDTDCVIQTGWATAYFGINAKVSGAEPYLFGRYHGEDWLFLESAKDIDGNDMKFREKDRDVLKRGRIEETFFLDAVNMNYLKRHKNSGIDIKLYGLKGDSAIKISPESIQGFLNWLKNNNIK